jgi:hypothetical protein
LGVLAKIARSTALIEPYRNPPTRTEVGNCPLKLFAQQTRQRVQSVKMNFYRTNIRIGVYNLAKSD